MLHIYFLEYLFLKYECTFSLYKATDFTDPHIHKKKKLFCK